MVTFLVLFIIFMIIVLILVFGRRIEVIRRGSEILRIRRLSPIRSIIIGIVGFILLVFIPSSIKVVPVGRALVIFNIITKKYYVSREGINFILPIINQTTMYDLRRQEYTMSASPVEAKRKGVVDALWTPTKEGLEVGLDLTCWYRISPEMVWMIHKNIGPDYEEKVIRPAIRGLVRITISKYGIMEVYSGKREEIQKEITNRLRELLKPDGIIIEGVILRNVRFTEDFAKAIEEKQVAQQEAEKMKYLLEKEQMEAQRKKIEAEGKAKAIEIVGRQLKMNPAYIQYLYVDKLSDDVQVIIADQSTILDLKSFLKR